MPKLPRVSGAETIRALSRLGFDQVRQRGSHVVLKRLGSDSVAGCVRSHTQRVSQRNSSWNSEASGRDAGKVYRKSLIVGQFRSRGGPDETEILHFG